MKFFIFIIFHLVFLNQIDTNLINRVLTWRFETDHQSQDWNKLRQQIRLGLDRWAEDKNVVFRETIDNEKADLYVTFVLGHHADSDGILFDGNEGPSTGYIYRDSIEFATEDSIDVLRTIVKNAIVFVELDDEISMSDERTGRFSRSAKKDKKKKKKKKGRKSKSITFLQEDLDAVNDFILNSKPEYTLKEFSAISTMINNVTGLFTKENIPLLKELAVSYADTTKLVKVSFADSCAILSKFVIKAYRIMKRSMNRKDEKMLKSFEKQIKSETLDQFNSFVEDSRKKLVDIHSRLLERAFGNSMKTLLKQRTVAENELLQKAEDLKKKNSDVGALKAKLDSMRYEREFVKKAMVDSEAAHKEAQSDLKKLKDQIPEHDQRILDRRNTRTTEYGRFWIFSWRVRDVTHDNGENIARENRERLMDRIRALEGTVRNWSNENSMKRVSTLEHDITLADKDLTVQEKFLQKENESYTKSESKFFDILQEMKKIETDAGTVNVESMDAVDRLARAVLSGQESFVNADAAVRESIKGLEIDPDLMSKSIEAALKFLQLGDDYMKKTRIDDIRRILGIKRMNSIEI